MSNIIYVLQEIQEGNVFKLVGYTWSFEKAANWTKDNKNRSFVSIKEEAL